MSNGKSIVEALNAGKEGRLKSNYQDQAIYKKISSVCEALCPDGSLAIIPIVPGDGCKPNECFANVRRHVEANGGQAQYGWCLDVDPDEPFVVANNHALWMAPDGSLIDVTPTLLPEQVAVFLSDDGAAPIDKGDACWPHPSRAFPLTKNPRSKRLARRVNQQEWTYWAALQKGDYEYAKAYIEAIFDDQE
jgi:hypothetical protein